MWYQCATVGPDRILRRACWQSCCIWAWHCDRFCTWGVPPSRGVCPAPSPLLFSYSLCRCVLLGCSSTCINLLLLLSRQTISFSFIFSSSSCINLLLLFGRRTVLSRQTIPFSSILGSSTCINLLLLLGRQTISSSSIAFTSCLIFIF